MNSDVQSIINTIMDEANKSHVWYMIPFIHQKYRSGYIYYQLPLEWNYRICDSYLMNIFWYRNIYNEIIIEEI
jgi:hypothetical protein